MDNSLKEIKKYYSETDKTWITKYTGHDGKVYSGEEYFNGNLTSRISFKYDERGNTIERTEYDIANDEFILFQNKFQYDNKINPCYQVQTLFSDIIQYNNPVYTYMFNAYMSSLPPEYNISYEYNSLDLPVKEYHEHVGYSAQLGTYVYEYIYTEKN